MIYWLFWFLSIWKKNIHLEDNIFYGSSCNTPSVHFIPHFLTSFMNWSIVLVVVYMKEKYTSSRQHFLTVRNVLRASIGVVINYSCLLLECWKYTKSFANVVEKFLALFYLVNLWCSDQIILELCSPGSLVFRNIHIWLLPWLSAILEIWQLML